MLVLTLRTLMFRFVWLALLWSAGGLFYAWAATAALEKPAALSVSDPSALSSLKDEELDARLQEVALTRKALDQRLTEGRAACYQKFAVNDCIRILRTQNREEFDRLRQVQISLEDEQRRRQSQLKLALVEEKKRQLALQQQLDAQRLPIIQSQQTAKVEEKRVEKQTLDAQAQARLRSQQERLRLAEIKIQEYERKLKERAASGKPRAPSLGIPLPLR